MVEAETNEINGHAPSCLNLTAILLICIITHFIDRETQGYSWEVSELGFELRCNTEPCLVHMRASDNFCHYWVSSSSMPRDKGG